MHQESDLAVARMILDGVPKTMGCIRSIARETAQQDMTIPQFRVLVKLSSGSATLSELSEWQGVSLPAMSRMVDTLIKRRLVTSRRSRSDRRQIQVELSTQGASQYEKYREQNISKLILRLNGFSRKEKEQLTEGLRVLEKIGVNLK